VITGERTSNGAAFRHHIECRGAAVEVRSDGYCTVLTATGEVDAANADIFLTTLARYAAGPCPVIVDLRPLGFLGTVGLRGLLSFNDRCARSGTRWALLGGPTTQRLIGIVRPSRQLPTADSLAEAIGQFPAPPSAETG
jgi:anti-anti-sigma factor